jgi:hypothetical protein
MTTPGFNRYRVSGFIQSNLPMALEHCASVDMTPIAWPQKNGASEDAPLFRINLP